MNSFRFCVLSLNDVNARTKCTLHKVMHKCSVVFFPILISTALFVNIVNSHSFHWIEMRCLLSRRRSHKKPQRKTQIQAQGKHHRWLYATQLDYYRVSRIARGIGEFWIELAKTEKRALWSADTPIRIEIVKLMMQSLLKINIKLCGMFRKRTVWKLQRFLVING